MQIHFSTTNLVIAVLVTMLAGHSGLARAKKMYRWIDEQGKVFYSDKIQPKDVRHRREALNESVRVIEVTEKEKTKEQRELDKRLQLLREQQQAIIDKQKAHDKVLLSTFRNVGDMQVALKGQMLALDGKRKVVRGNLERLEQQLLQKQKRAAQYERDGRLVPLKLLEDINESRKQIEKTYVELANQFEKKKKVREDFQRDIKRFIYLVESKKNDQDDGYLSAKNKAASELGLFICDTIKQCDQAWQGAKQFVRKYSTVALDIENDALIMSQKPFKDTDISLSVSRMNEDDGSQQLFLDIRCRQSTLGDQLCRSRKVKDMRYSFNDFIRSTIETDE